MNKHQTELMLPTEWTSIDRDIKVKRMNVKKLNMEKLNVELSDVEYIQVEQPNETLSQKSIMSVGRTLCKRNWKSKWDITETVYNILGKFRVN